MTVEKSPDDPAVQYAGERLVMRLGMKLCDELIAIYKAPNPKPLLVLRSAAETDALG